MAKLLEVGLLPSAALEEAYTNLRHQVRSMRIDTVRRACTEYSMYRYGTPVLWIRIRCFFDPGSPDLGSQTRIFDRVA